MDLRAHLLAGQVIPAHPLALDENRRLDERRQRALTRYYLAAGAGGLAVGVHTTQFAIRDPKHGLYRPVLELASETIDAALRLPSSFILHPSSFIGRGDESRPFVKVAGICGRTAQAEAEAETARTLGYHAGLLSLSAIRDAPDEELLRHCRAVADVLPVFGFYLQPSVGGRALGHAFWRRFAEIENVVAIKIAPFNRYQTLDVARAVAESGREDIALYTGNDDNIVVDLLTRCEFMVEGRRVERRIVGGLLGHWAVWTRRAVEMLEEIKAAREQPRLDAAWLTRAAAVTDMNAALFDPANGFAGCIAGIHEVLRRQGLLRGTWCLDPGERLSPGQAEEIDRVVRAYPDLTDDDFVAAHREEWLQ
jgi:dihydrodipicolinate synthase/N-acetylneuraminate lyase